MPTLSTVLFVFRFLQLSPSCPLWLFFLSFKSVIPSQTLHCVGRVMHFSYNLDTFLGLLVCVCVFYESDSFEELRPVLWTVS